jgi:hypothetical protein
MPKLEWHISNFAFCNGIFPIGESWSGMDTINPFIKHTHTLDVLFVLLLLNENYISSP